MTSDGKLITKEFEQLKDSVSTDKYLQYYDRTAPIILEVDASQKGIGEASETSCIFLKNTHRIPVYVIKYRT